MKVAIYCRVSTSDQTTETQRLPLVRHAETEGWDYDVYEEVMSTRKTRPVKYDLFHSLRAGQYDAVLVLKLDRWARSSRELINEITELQNKGITFISLRDNIDFSTATGKLQFQMLAAFAEFERELIRERVMEGLKRAKEQGKKPGRPKGSKDKTKRRKSGYLLRPIREQQRHDEKRGIFRPLSWYADNGQVWRKNPDWDLETPPKQLEGENHG